MNTHIMIDIETLGKADDAVVLSFGAVAFNKNGIIERSSELIYEDVAAPQEIYRELEVQAQINAGRTIDLSTLKWWQDQETPCPLSGEELEGSLMDLHHFIADNDPQQIDKDEDLPDDPPVLYIWAHGVTFDITKLQSLFALAYNFVPWEHWQIMDCRTMVQLWPTVREGRKENNHNALDDARNQVQWLLDLDKKLNFL